MTNRQAQCARSASLRTGHSAANRSLRPRLRSRGLPAAYRIGALRQSLPRG